MLKGSDRDHILAVYLIGRGEGIRAAPIDTETGEFIGSGAMRPIESKTLADVAAVRTHLTTSSNSFLLFPIQILELALRATRRN